MVVTESCCSLFLEVDLRELRLRRREGRILPKLSVRSWLFVRSTRCSRQSMVRLLQRFVQVARLPLLFGMRADESLNILPLSGRLSALTFLHWCRRQRPGRA